MKRTKIILSLSVLFIFGCTSNYETTPEVKSPAPTETTNELKKNKTNQLVREARKLIGEEYSGAVMDSISSIHGELKMDMKMSNLYELYGRASKTELIFVINNDTYKITEVLPPMPKNK